MHLHNDHSHESGAPASRTALHEELVQHLPFSVSAVAIGLTVAGIICFLTPVEPAGAPCAAHDTPFRSLFHLFHPMHMLFSAAATTAMFWRYERSVLKAVVIGLVGAVGVCGLSDIVMPHASLTMLGKRVEWHICVIEHPRMVLSFAAVGVLVGLAASRGVRRSTFFSHSLHVFSSTMASIFYLIGPLGHLAWIDSIGVVFLLVVAAVMVPCCLSDIVFPLLLAGAARERHREEHVGCG